VADTKRIGHGVRAIEDPQLMDYLRKTQIPLEVCLTSNICLKVYPSLKEHSLPILMEQGLYVTLNSDDPPMFNTTLTNEYLVGYKTFGWNVELIQSLVLNAVKVTLLSEQERIELLRTFSAEFMRLTRNSGEA
jgi:adenosine deaminase